MTQNDEAQRGEQLAQCTRPDVLECHARIGTGMTCMNGVQCAPSQVADSTPAGSRAAALPWASNKHFKEVRDDLIAHLENSRNACTLPKKPWTFEFSRIIDEAAWWRWLAEKRAGNAHPQRRCDDPHHNAMREAVDAYKKSLDDPEKNWTRALTLELIRGLDREVSVSAVLSVATAFCVAAISVIELRARGALMGFPMIFSLGLALLAAHMRIGAELRSIAAGRLWLQADKREDARKIDLLASRGRRMAHTILQHAACALLIGYVAWALAEIVEMYL